MSLRTNKYWSIDRVRQTFIEYFKSKNHKYIPSSSIIPPEEDSSLLFTNAGMNQFKSIFLGETQNNLKRATNSQKCIRAGGKHNDLEDVGKDIYHHTFFEMCGNWSFGDYWKEEAIDYVWDLLINIYNLDPNKIYVTYFKGNNKLKLKPDLESKKIWSKYLPNERILPFGMKDNFWEMGNTGPCGPCTEIHYDRSDTKRDSSSLVNQDDPSVLEIWNIVFIQYNRINKTTLIPLKHKYIDTGLGLERLTSILQKVESNYDIDTFQYIIKHINTISNVAPYTNKVGIEDTNEKDTSYRIIADHMRMAVISLGDGLLPGTRVNSSVLRRVIKRAINRGLNNLGLLKTDINSKTYFIYDPFLYKLVKPVCQTLSSFYTEFSNEKFVNLISQIMHNEEMVYRRLLSNGHFNLMKTIKRLKNKNEKILSKNTIKILCNSLGYPRWLIAKDCQFSDITIEK